MKSPHVIRLVAAAFLLGVLSAAGSVAAAADLTVIDLHYRSADEILPILRPIAGPDVALSGVDYKLLVRGSAAEVARIREALAVLDRAPRQFLVSVRYGASPQSKASEIGVGGRSGNNGSQIIIRGGTTTTTASDNSTSSVRVLEGNGAHIASGQSVPVVSAIMLPSRTGDRTTIGMGYRDLTSGFNVVPRVNGERVMLDIATQQQRLIDANSTDANSGSAAVQNTTTTVAGRLGEWIELGGVTSSTSEQSSGISIASGTQRITTQSDQRSIAVKVEQVD